jgi:hypothetical protein
MEDDVDLKLTGKVALRHGINGRDRVCDCPIARDRKARTSRSPFTGILIEDLITTVERAEHKMGKHPLEAGS